MEEDYHHQQQASSSHYQPIVKKIGKQHNTLPLWGNEATMNLNPLILANIQSSSYFKVHLFKLKTYHEVVDEIYYQVKHMEPWERGSRKTSGQTGMCGGVRGVGAGGIVSTAYCLLYKLYTLRLTRKQVNGLINHTDSPYIRALGFMYLRYTQPPADLYDWYENYLQDEEEIDVKAGGGQIITIGQMVYQFLTKLDWFTTLFPRIPVPIQKQIEKRIEQYCRDYNISTYHLINGTFNSVAITGGIGTGVGAGRSARYDGQLIDSGNYDRSARYREQYNTDRRDGSGGPPKSQLEYPIDEHDDRDRNHRYRDVYHHHSTTSSSARDRERSRLRRLENEAQRYSTSPESVYRGSSRERERYREKYKKKHKHRSPTLRSRSRSRSRKHSRSRSSHSERKRSEKDHRRHHKHHRSRRSKSGSRHHHNKDEKKHR